MGINWGKKECLKNGDPFYFFALLVGRMGISPFFEGVFKGEKDMLVNTSEEK